MAQHFLLSPEALEEFSLVKLSDKTQDFRAMLAKLRWGHVSQQVCPYCGDCRSHHDVPSRKQWRCRSCFGYFSVTSKTIFSNSKISYQQLLMGMYLYVTAVKGMSALQMRRLLGTHYRTAYVLMHKIREVMVHAIDDGKQLKGVVEIDGAHVSGRPRKGRKQERVAQPDEGKQRVPAKYSKKALQNQKELGLRTPQHRDKAGPLENETDPNRRVVLVMREIGEHGAKRTVTVITDGEKKSNIEAAITKYVKRGATIRTDELIGYVGLRKLGYKHETVNHSVEFSTDDGVNQNQAESYFSRMRRGIIGNWHRVTPGHMHHYMTEIAWHEDMRRQGSKSQMEKLVRLLLSFEGTSRFVNYGRDARKRLLERRRNGDPAKEAIAKAYLESGAGYLKDLAVERANGSKPDDGFEDVPF